MKKEQLKMETKIQDFQSLKKDFHLPVGYILTRFYDGLEDSWSELLNSSGFDSEWNIDRVKDYFSCCGYW